MKRRLPLVAICAAWRDDQVLYSSCTLGVYSDAVVLCVFTHKSLALGGKARLRNAAQYSGPIELCVCVAVKNYSHMCNYELNSHHSSAMLVISTACYHGDRDFLGSLNHQAQLHWRVVPAMQ